MLLRGIAEHEIPENKQPTDRQKFRQILDSHMFVLVREVMECVV
jgi:hypothetical protein